MNQGGSRSAADTLRVGSDVHSRSKAKRGSALPAPVEHDTSSKSPTPHQKLNGFIWQAKAAKDVLEVEKASGVNLNKNNDASRTGVPTAYTPKQLSSLS